MSAIDADNDIAEILTGCCVIEYVYCTESFALFGSSLETSWRFTIGSPNRSTPTTMSNEQVAVSPIASGLMCSQTRPNPGIPALATIKANALHSTLNGTERSVMSFSVVIRNSDAVSGPRFVTLNVTDVVSPGDTFGPLTTVMEASRSALTPEYATASRVCKARNNRKQFCMNLANMEKIGGYGWT